MSSLLKLRRGSALAHTTFTGSEGETTYTTDTHELVTHDGVTVGGFPGGGYMPAGTGAVGTTVQSKLRESVSVKDFGAIGDGVADDGPAFNSALAASHTVVVPPGNYLVKTQIIVQSGGHLVGESGSTPLPVTTGGARLIYHSDLADNPMVDCQETYIFSFIAFTGPAKGTGTAVKTKKVLATAGVAYADTDVTFHGCSFYDWHTGVEHWNRGLWFDNNVVALCTKGLTITADAVNWVDAPGNVYDLIDNGFRAIRIENNRFHATTLAIENIGTNAEKLRGLSVSNNLIDIGDSLFAGGCCYSAFTGNIVDQTSDTAITFTTDVTNVIISGNVFRGDNVQVTYPFQLVYFVGTATDCTISGNVFSNAGAYGINHGIAALRCTYSGNLFTDIGDGATVTHACIRYQAAATDCAITGNAFNPRAAAYCVRGTTSDTWTGVVMQGNSWPSTAILYGVFAVGINNTLQALDRVERTRPVAISVGSTTSTITASSIVNGLRSGTPAAANINLTVPLGTDVEAAISINTGYGFTWSLINLAAATNTFTLIANTGHTVYGNPVVNASSSGMFMTRKASENVFVTYRIS